MTIRTAHFEDYDVNYRQSYDIKDAVFNRVLEYFLNHKAFSGEVIMQNDNCTIDAAGVLADIADDIIKFDVVYTNDC
jgi:hypothetical protein